MPGMEWSLVVKLPNMFRQRRRNVFDKCYGLSEERIICRWKCSLWKLVLKELIIYAFLFLSISLIYRQGHWLQWTSESQPKFKIYYRKVLSLPEQDQFEALIKWSRLHYHSFLMPCKETTILWHDNNNNNNAENSYE